MQKNFANWPILFASMALSAVVLKPVKGRYLIIAGERRYRAARMAGVKQVPAVIKEVSEQELLQLSIIENIQREDLNPLEEAEGIAELMAQFSLRQEEAAEILGRSRSAVANSLRLLNLPQECKKCSGRRKPFCRSCQGLAGY